MTHPHGTVEDGELWLRCPHCGDSQRNEWKAHHSINLRSGKFYCLKCGAKGVLTIKQLLALADYADVSIFVGEDRDDPEIVLPDLTPGPATRRYSMLDRWKHFRDGEWRDAFPMHEPDGTLVGIYLRGDGKTSEILGEVGYSWVEGEVLRSTPNDLYRIVEGPYDVLESNDLCIFGTISRGRLESLRGQYLLLCPDGDVWTDPGLLKQFRNTLRWLLRRPWNAPMLVGVEYLPDNKDPDEVPIPNRERLDEVQLRRLIR